MPDARPSHLKEAPFTISRRTDLRCFRDALEKAGYTLAALAQTARLWESGERPDYAVMLRRTTDSTPYNTAVRLFALSQPVPAAAAEAILGTPCLQMLTSLGLLYRSEEGLRAKATILPWEGFLIARDVSPALTGKPAAPNHVLGLGPASLTLAGLTVRRTGERVLDLGTGLGIQALLASRHAAQVIGTDTNRRALNFASLNACLNGVWNLELREGSLYDPVEAEAFSLVVANPPFVISPESRYDYRDSGLPGDAISEQVIRQAPTHLREGGYCVVLFNWHHQEETDWADRPRDWIESSGCDAWLLHYKTEDPLTYAATWLRSTEGKDPRAYAHLIDEWVAYYRRMDIRFISKGAVILRRRAGSNWFRADSVPPEPPKGSCSNQIQRIFASRTFLHGLASPRDLLSQRLALTSHHQVEQKLQALDGGWSLKGAYLRQTEGFEFAGELDPLVSALLAGCDGRRPLAGLLDEIAEEKKMDRDQITNAGLTITRTLMEFGFLGLPEHARTDG